MDNQKKSKEIKIHKISFKYLKRFSTNKKPKKKNSCTSCLYKEKKNSIQNSSIKNIIKKIKDKYSMIDNNLIKSQRRNKSSNKLFGYKFNKQLFLKQKSYKTIEEEKNNNFTTNETPINIKISQLNDENKKKSIKELKRCKTVCNNNKKILNNKVNEQETKNNINKVKKRKNGKKEIKLGKKKANNKSQKYNEKSEEKRQLENFTKNIKNKFLCCFFL